MTAILPFSTESAAPAMLGRGEAATSADAAAFGASLEQALMAAALVQPEVKPADQASLADLARALLEFAGEADGTEPCADDAACSAEESAGAALPGTAAPLGQGKGVSQLKADAAPELLFGEKRVDDLTAARETPVRAATESATAVMEQMTWRADSPDIEAAATRSVGADAQSGEVILGEPASGAAQGKPAAELRTAAKGDAASDDIGSTELDTDAQPVLTDAAPGTAAGAPLAGAAEPLIAQQIAAAAMVPQGQPALTAAINGKSSPRTEVSAHSDRLQADQPSGERARSAAAEASAFLQSSASRPEAPMTELTSAKGAASPDTSPDAAERIAELGSNAIAPTAELVSATNSRESTVATSAPADAAVAISTGSTTLPAGVRVLELQAEAARRRTITGAARREARTQPAPRTAAQAGAELQAGTAMPSVAAEAIEQLRRPAIALVREGESARGRNPAAAGLRLVSSTETPSDPTRPVLTLEPAETRTGGEADSAALRSGAGELTLRQQADQAFTGSNPLPSAAGHAGGSPTVAVSASRPDAPAQPAPIAAPTTPELQRPGQERISVRLGDDVGSPVVRINIRGDQVNARIVTPDVQLANDLGRGVRELASALEARGFETARVQVRGTGSAYEHIGPAQLAGSGIAESRSASETRSDDRHQAPEDRAQGWREAEAHERRQGRRPRRTHEDEEQP